MKKMTKKELQEKINNELENRVVFYRASFDTSGYKIIEYNI